MYHQEKQNQLHQPLNCVIVEDNALARQSLRFMIEQHPMLHLQGFYDTGKSALEGLEAQVADILFLDVELPDMSGIDLLKKLSFKPMVIFTTIGREYAADAFDNEAVDFLLKPIEFSRFCTAIEKVQRLYEKKGDGDARSDDTLVLRDGRRMVRLHARDIIRAEALGDYVKVYANRQVHTIHSTMKEVEEKLRSFGFERVHRSHIVRLDAIEKLQDRSIFIEGAEVPVSETYRDQVMQHIHQGALRI